jgi:hypothetical protein
MNDVIFFIVCFLLGMTMSQVHTLKKKMKIIEKHFYELNGGKY